MKSKDPNILSFRSHVSSKRGTFLRHPVVGIGQPSSMESMADAHPRFLLELLLAHLIDLQQKQ